MSLTPLKMIETDYLSQLHSQGHNLTFQSNGLTAVLSRQVGVQWETRQLASLQSSICLQTQAAISLVGSSAL
jgi:hypothetical protein